MAVTEHECKRANRRGAAVRAQAPATVRAVYRSSRHKGIQKCFEVMFENGMMLTIPVARRMVPVSRHPIARASGRG
jgi:hypothetical protein